MQESTFPGDPYKTGARVRIRDWAMSTGPDASVYNGLCGTIESIDGAEFWVALDEDPDPDLGPLCPCYLDELEIID